MIVGFLFEAVVFAIVLCIGLGMVYGVFVAVHWLLNMDEKSTNKKARAEEHMREGAEELGAGAVGHAAPSNHLVEYFDLLFSVRAKQLAALLPPQYYVFIAGISGTGFFQRGVIKDSLEDAKDSVVLPLGALWGRSAEVCIFDAAELRFRRVAHLQQNTTRVGATILETSHVWINDDLCDERVPVEYPENIWHQHARIGGGDLAASREKTAAEIPGLREQLTAIVRGGNGPVFTFIDTPRAYWSRQNNYGFIAVYPSLQEAKESVGFLDGACYSHNLGVRLCKIEDGRFVTISMLGERCEGEKCHNVWVDEEEE